MDKRITDIPDGMIITMNYPNVQCMMTGIKKAAQDNKGVIKLLYVDGAIQQRKADFYIEDKSCFEIVRFVQEAYN